KTVLDQNAIESSQITGAGQSLRTFAYNRLFETAYGNDAVGHSLTGGQDIAKLTEPGFNRFAAQAGAPDKLLVVIAGDIEPTYATLLSNRWFGHRQAALIPVEKKVANQRPNTPSIAVNSPMTRTDLKLPTKDD